MDIYKMKLGEFFEPDVKINYHIVRVPGGWIYRFWNSSQYDPVFVPYNEEFIKNENYKQT